MIRAESAGSRESHRPIPQLLLVSSSYHPVEGGAERQLRQVLEELVAVGRLRVTVLSARQRGLPTHEVLAGVSINRVGLPAGKKSAKLGFLFGTLMAALSQGPPDVVLSSQLGVASTSGAVIARLMRTKHVIRLAGGGGSHGTSEPIERSRSWMSRLRVSWMVKRGSTTVVAPADHLLRDMSRCFPHLGSRTLLVPNGVDVPRSLPEKTEQVVWYGKSGGGKDIDGLLRIASLCPEIQFDAIGPLDPVAVPPNVRVLGWVDNPELVISRHRVALLTSRSEGMPNFGLQALATGTPVVAYRNLGTEELAGYGAGLVDLADFGDSQSVVDAIRARLITVHPPSPLVLDIRRVAQLWERLW